MLIIITMILELDDRRPIVPPSAWVAPNAVVVGYVELGESVSIWYGATIRAEGAPIIVGANTNVQDGCVVHADLEHSVSLGRGVIVGHGALVHGCAVGDDVLIGMGAILLNGCKIGSGSIVAAGALVPEGLVVPPDSLVMGSPARSGRQVRPAERQRVMGTAAHYVELAERHRVATRLAD
jgi:carbonic anhydrase/acetyltransferase-like protein (isoleucine patch superfamily)